MKVSSLKITASLLFLLLATQVSAQFIVSIDKDAKAPILKDIKAISPYITLDVLDEEEGVFLIKGLKDQNELNTISGIEEIIKDEALEQRATPNDDLYNSQYSLDLIGLPKVWETLTDAVDFGGREIVVAVLDNGYQIDHEDLSNNIYINEGEIPDNSLDDDGNGLIDDYKGWNIDTNNDKHPVNTHGTAVAGIIGAEGNNGIGIAGVSWKVKILPFSGIDIKSEIIQAYAKIRNLRDLYNKTNGQKGAYIVVTNYSGGISNAFAEDNVLWCNQYDKLGEVGILSVGATSNTDVDVDIVGDMPSTCTSPFLVVTTNTSANDTKVKNAAYGNVSVDIGAPGEDIVTTNVGNGYSDFLGTSAAAPHVAGAIALLYATPCPSFHNSTLENPTVAATAVKNAILNSTKPILALRDISTTEGRLDVNEAFKEMQNLCGGTSGDLDIVSLGPIPVEGILNVRYETPDSEPYSLRITNDIGQVVQQTTIIPPFFGEKFFILNIDTGMPAGIYFISIYNDKNISTRKFIKAD